VNDLELAVEAARLAGSVAAQWFGRPLEVTVKGAPANVVTVADTAAEHAVRDLLARERPQDGLLGEEGSSRPGTRRWLVDAIDGTLNFTRNDPFWCSAVALEDPDGGLVAAVHHVATEQTWSAARGEGCWLNGVPLALSADRPLEECVLSTYLHPGDASRSPFQQAIEAAASVRVRGSGSLELAWVAAGRIDVWLQRDVLPWDWAPGALLVSEAGGTSEVRSRGDGAWHVAGTPRAAAELTALLGPSR
jgi:myo-inositol-1(or 4)-monophosphatase